MNLSKSKFLLNLLNGAFFFGMSILSFQFLPEDVKADGPDYDWSIHSAGGTGDQGSNYLVCDQPEGSACFKDETGWGWLS